MLRNKVLNLNLNITKCISDLNELRGPEATSDCWSDDDVASPLIGKFHLQLINASYVSVDIEEFGLQKFFYSIFEYNFVCISNDFETISKR